MLPDETELTDSLTRARREHRHAVLRRDDEAARLLQSAIAALEQSTRPAPAAVPEPPRTPMDELVARRIHACRPDIPFATIVRAAREAAIQLAVSTGERPSPEQVEAAALAHLDA
jgi:hypothetical protein